MFASQLPESIIKGLSIRARQLGAVNLGQGIPSFPTAPHIINAAKSALDDPTIGIYPNFFGEIELREAIGEKLNKERLHSSNITYDHILVTVGAMEATAAAILSLIQNDEIVGIVTPDYCNHLPQALLSRSRVVEIPCTVSEKEYSDGKADQRTWRMDLSRIEEVAQSGMKLLIFTNPSNPTGSVATREELTHLIQLAETYHFYILADETYSYLTYHSPFISLLEFWDASNQVLVVRSFSKEYAMTGWRVGYLVAHPSFIQQCAKVHDALVGCVPKISQRAALSALKGSQDIVQEYQKVLSRRREIAISLLSKISLIEFPHPQGAYYIFPRYTYAMNSQDLCENMLIKQKVAVIPGAAFGQSGESHFRISFAVDDDILAEGIHRIQTFFDTLPE